MRQTLCWVLMACTAAAASAAEQANQGRSEPSGTAADRDAQPRELRSFRLLYADPSSIVAEITRGLGPDGVRMVADARTRSVIAVAPRKTLDMVAEIVTKLDVPSAPPRAEPPSPRTTAVEAVPVSNMKADYLARALAGLLGRQGSYAAGDDLTAVVVLKATPATQKAIEVLSGPLNAPPTNTSPRNTASPSTAVNPTVPPPPQPTTDKGAADANRRAEIRIVRIPRMNADAVARALAAVADARGSKIVVIPREGTSQGSKEVAARPEARR